MINRKPSSSACVFGTFSCLDSCASASLMKNHLTLTNLPSTSALNYGLSAVLAGVQAKLGFMLKLLQKKRHVTVLEQRSRLSRRNPPQPATVEPKTVIWATELLSGHRRLPPLPCVCWLRCREDVAQQQGTLGNSVTAKTSLAARVSKHPRPERGGTQRGAS